MIVYWVFHAENFNFYSALKKRLKDGAAWFFPYIYSMYDCSACDVNHTHSPWSVWPHEAAGRLGGGYCSGPHTQKMRERIYV